jgi:hypothetical protein
MVLRRTSRGLVVQSSDTTHTATIRSGPLAGEAHICICPRRANHYVNMSPGLMDMHPTLF